MYQLRKRSYHGAQIVIREGDIPEVYIGTQNDEHERSLLELELAHVPVLVLGLELEPVRVFGLGMFLWLEPVIYLELELAFELALELALVTEIALAKVLGVGPEGAVEHIRELSLQKLEAKRI